MVPNLTGRLVMRCAVFHIARVLQPAAADRADDVRKHARFEEVVQDVPARIGDRADLVGRRLGDLGKAVHVGERIALPAHAADFLVVMRVAVGDDVEAGGFLRAQEARHRVLVLLAVARVHHRFEEAASMPSTAVYQDGRGSEPMIEVWQSCDISPASTLSCDNRPFAHSLRITLPQVADMP